MDTVNVRRMQPGDAALWGEAVHTLVPAVEREGRLVPAVELAAALADSRCYLFLALRDGRPVGLLSAYRFPEVTAGGHCVYLYDLIVAEGHRRRGTGAALVQALLAACRAEGVRHLWAGTALGNAAAQRTFAATGATRVGETYAEYEWKLER